MHDFGTDALTGLMPPPGVHPHTSRSIWELPKPREVLAVRERLRSAFEQDVTDEERKVLDIWWLE